MSYAIDQEVKLTEGISLVIHRGLISFEKGTRLTIVSPRTENTTTPEWGVRYQLNDAMSVDFSVSEKSLIEAKPEMVEENVRLVSIIGDFLELLEGKADLDHLKYLARTDWREMGLDAAVQALNSLKV